MRKEVDTVGCRGDPYLARLANGRAVCLNKFLHTDGRLAELFSASETGTDNREQSEVAKSLLGRRACHSERIETIGKPRQINGDVV